MIVKLLGILDLIAILFLLLKEYFNFKDWFPMILLTIAGIYLLVKGIIFILTLDFASAIDIISGIIIIFAAHFDIPQMIVLVVIVVLGQKAVFSLIS